MRSFFETLLAIAVLGLFHRIGEQIILWYPIPLSGALLGMLLLLATMAFLPKFANWLTNKVTFLLKHMVFFFIPAVMGISAFTVLIHQFAFSLFFAVIVSTCISLALCAWIAERMFEKKQLDERGRD